jgi:hypothetical protein
MDTGNHQASIFHTSVHVRDPASILADIGFRLATSVARFGVANWQTKKRGVRDPYVDGNLFLNLRRARRPRPKYFVDAFHGHKWARHVVPLLFFRFLLLAAAYLSLIADS